ncbi:MAG: hypothetical protein VX304_08205 [Planctomycetota bacterium]|nr:hypothetical protein [Planctomycetota bacterium]
MSAIATPFTIPQHAPPLPIVSRVRYHELSRPQPRLSLTFGSHSWSPYLVP